MVVLPKMVALILEAELLLFSPLFLNSRTFLCTLFWVSEALREILHCKMAVCHECLDVRTFGREA